MRFDFNTLLLFVFIKISFLELFKWRGDLRQFFTLVILQCSHVFVGLKNVATFVGFYDSLPFSTFILTLFFFSLYCLWLRELGFYFQLFYLSVGLSPGAIQFIGPSISQAIDTSRRTICTYLLLKCIGSSILATVLIVNC